jgi:DNA primase
MAPIGANPNPNPNPNPYLDIEKIRTEITMAHILDYYEIELTRISQNHLAGCCPIHRGDNSNAFHVDLEKNLFHCFTRCGGGSIFDFVMKKENISFYQAAKKVWETFYPQEQEQKQKDQRLHFQLTLQPDHPYLRRRNIDVNLARHFQMGFCQYGMMKNRIAIPIFDRQRKLVAYCGRAVEEHMRPKYLFPKNFTKSHYLFNIQNIDIDIDIDIDTDTDTDISSKSNVCHHQTQTKPVFIVEGFFDCIHLVKLGFEALAVMGSSITHQQLALLKQINRFYILMLDGDEAGIRGMTRISQEMRRWNLLFKPVWLKLLDVKEPEDLGCNDLEMIANG